MRNNILKSIISTKYIQNIIREKYNLIDIEDVILVKTEINDIYKIATKNKSTYILKIYSMEKQLNDLKFEIDYIFYLIKKQLLVPCLIKSIENLYYIFIEYPEGKRLAILMEYIPGVKIQYNFSSASALGKNIAKLHSLSDLFNNSMLDMREYNVLKILNDSKIIIDKFVMNYYAKYSSEFYNIFHSLEILKEIKFTKRYCHNDLHSDNIIIYNKKIYILDFDFIGFGCALYDLAVFKWSCILNKRTDIWNDFLKNYQNASPILDNEIRYIDFFVIARDIITTAIYINKINCIGSRFVNETFITKRIKFIKSILNCCKRR
ncbi:phosphotransferase [Campylobacter coli]